MCKRKRVRPGTDPWGTPALKEVRSESDRSTNAWIFCLDRKDAKDEKSFWSSTSLISYSNPINSPGTLPQVSPTSIFVTNQFLPVHKED